jgi:prepilin-type N-terminal cleavage/methylation domain-containing protein/prepilin-type processing-associated H-X9-DG protein
MNASSISQPAAVPFKSAFTLIELLLVLAVVSVLAGLLLAPLSRTKSSALSSKCQSNLRQMGLVLNNFLADQKVFPLSANPEFFQGKFLEHKSGWFEALSDQLSHQIFNTNGTARTQEGVFDCPAASQPNDWPPGWDYSDYGYNAHGLGGSGSESGLGGQSFGPSLRPTPEAEVRVPADMIAFGDGFRGWTTIIHDGSPSFERTKAATLSPDKGGTQRALKRHAEKANAVFRDGHIEPAKLSTFFSDTSDEALRRWNKDNLPHREKLN